MSQFIKSIALFGALGALAACGGAGADGGGGPVVDEPDPPTISNASVVSARNFINGVNSRRDTSDNFLTILPFGTATYSGRAYTDLTINGEDSVDGLYGAISMTAQLSGPGNTVSGTISNIHTRNGDTPVERLDGTLAINGTLNDQTKRMSGNVSGQLTGVIGDGKRGDLAFSGGMSGRTQDTRTGTNIFGAPTYDLATGIAGSIAGRITGSETGSFSGSWAVSE